MARPTLLIAEPEPRDGLSTRKLVLETAKFNVITAHSSEEMVELLSLFPKVDALVIVAELKGIAKALKTAKKQKPDLPVIALSPNGTSRFELADHNVSTHEPDELLHFIATALRRSSRKQKQSLLKPPRIVCFQLQFCAPHEPLTTHRYRVQ